MSLSQSFIQVGNGESIHNLFSSNKSSGRSSPIFVCILLPCTPTRKVVFNLSPCFHVVDGICPLFLKEGPVNEKQIENILEWSIESQNTCWKQSLYAIRTKKLNFCSRQPVVEESQFCAMWPRSIKEDICTRTRFKSSFLVHMKTKK